MYHTSNTKGCKAALKGKFQGALWASKQFNLKDLDGRPNKIFKEPFSLPNIFGWAARASKLLAQINKSVSC